MTHASIAVLSGSLTNKTWGGISWATYRTVEHMTANYPEDDVTLLFHLDNPIKRHDTGAHVAMSIDLPRRLLNLLDTRDNLHMVPVDGRRRAIKWAKEHDATVWGPEFGVLPTRKLRQVVTVHDLRQYSNYRDGGMVAWKHRLGMSIALRYADAVVAISPMTFEDLVPRVKRHRLHHIAWGVPQGPANNGHEGEAPECVEGRPYILTVYDPFPHKRMDLLRKVRPLLEKYEWDLVVVGDLRGTITPLRNPQVHYMGFVDDEKFASYMKAAALFLHPSEYEGFGHPPREAARERVPVLYNRRCKALATDMGDKAFSFDGDDDLVEALDTLMYHEDLRKSRLDEALAWASSYRWETTAAMYMDLFRRGGR